MPQHRQSLIPVRPQEGLKRVWSEASITQAYPLTEPGFIAAPEGQLIAVQTTGFLQPTTFAMHQPGFEAYAPSADVSPTWSELDGTFDSQEHIDSMLEYCKSYLEWLCPDVDPTLAAEVLSSRQEIQSCPTILAALCLASVGRESAFTLH